MYKKFLSLILSFIILLEGGNLSFAQGVNIPNNYVENKDGTSSYEDEEYSNYCENYPKNKFGQTADVDCALKNKIKHFRVDKEPSTEISQIGPLGETDVYLWKYIGLSQLTKTFGDLLVNSYKDGNKNKFVEEFISQTHDFFNISSVESTAIANNWVKTSKYSKAAGLTQEDVEKWAKQMLKELITNREKIKDNSFMKGFFCGGAGFFAALIMLIKIAGIALFGATGIGAVIGVLSGLGGYFWGKSGVDKELEKRTREAREQADMYDLRAGVYSSALDYILDSIKEKEWVGNDLLVAKLNFNKDRRHALVDFRNVKVKNVPNWDFEAFFGNLSQKLSKLINKYKEEL